LFGPAEHSPVPATHPPASARRGGQGRRLAAARQGSALNGASTLACFASQIRCLWRSVCGNDRHPHGRRRASGSVAPGRDRA
jgi:hypothetical protein